MKSIAPHLSFHAGQHSVGIFSFYTASEATSIGTGIRQTLYKFDDSKYEPIRPHSMMAPSPLGSLTSPGRSIPRQLSGSLDTEPKSRLETDVTGSAITFLYGCQSILVLNVSTPLRPEINAAMGTCQRTDLPKIIYRIRNQRIELESTGIETCGRPSAIEGSNTQVVFQCNSL